MKEAFPMYKKKKKNPMLKEKIQMRKCILCLTSHSVSFFEGEKGSSSETAVQRLFFSMTCTARGILNVQVRCLMSYRISINLRCGIAGLEEEEEEEKEDDIEMSPSGVLSHT